MTTPKEKNSYAIGADIGKNLKDSLTHGGFDVDYSIIAHGFKDAMAGKVELTDEEMKTIITELTKEARERNAAKAKAEADENERAGEAFLAANKSKEGVVTLPSGLQYKVVTQGTGVIPGPTDIVECNYRGTLINGKEFDSSYKHGQPIEFPVNRVIKGWTEVLQKMPAGSKYQVFIPASLAYGPRGSGPDIGPNEALIFDIELISVKKADAPTPAEAPKPAEPAKPSAPATK
ncbi:MAG: FKBP-type peptidyl-prolyl cis-trans isomerase [Acidobacteriota bacterium]|nr:FKBP-type peptidyl-prolyl cis-trans isomerase [Acidobacteriota bacterium]